MRQRQGVSVVAQDAVAARTTAAGSLRTAVPTAEVVAVVMRLLETARRTALHDGPKAARWIDAAASLLRSGYGVGTERLMAPTPGQLARWQIDRALEYFEANLSDVVRISEAAATVGLSTGYFTKLFHRAIGESPHRFLQRRRIERAQELMICSEKSLAEIAAECGLADQPHFCRVFRHFVGTTPGAWRSSQRFIGPQPPRGRGFPLPHT